MKKSWVIILLTALTLSEIGFTATSQVRADSVSLASLMPADTFFYADLHLGDANDAVNAIAQLLNRMNIPVSSNAILGSFNQSLSYAAKRPTSLQDDVFPWLGDRIAIGVYVPDQLIDSILVGRLLTCGNYNAQLAQPEFMFLATVKDDLAADVFFASHLTGNIAHSEDKIGDNTVNIYSSSPGNPVLAHWKGYLAIGGPSISRWLNNLKNNLPSLASDPSYKKVNGILKPNNLATAYLKLPFIAVPTSLVVELTLLGPCIGNMFSSINGTPVPTPTPSPTPTPIPRPSELTDALKSLGATAVGIYRTNQTWLMDIASSVDPASLGKLFSYFNIPATIDLNAPASSVATDFGHKLPDQATLVIIGSNPALMIRNGRSIWDTIVQLLAIITGNDGLTAYLSSTQGFGSLQSFLQQNFGLDLDQDILSWLNGDFAIYGAYSTRSDLAPAFPFNTSLLAETSDPAKTQSFISKLNAGLSKSGNTTPIESDGLFILPNARIAYGLLGNDFLASNVTGLTTSVHALQGNATLSSNENWKAAISSLPQSYQNLWYMNVDELRANFTSVAGFNDRSTSQIISIFSLFKSVVMYSTDLGGGNSVTTLTLNLN